MECRRDDPRYPEKSRLRKQTLCIMMTMGEQLIPLFHLESTGIEGPRLTSPQKCSNFLGDLHHGSSGPRVEACVA